MKTENEDPSEPNWDDDTKKALRLHRTAEAYALATHYEHAERYGDEEPSVATSALDVISHDCALVHRGVGGVCVIGYSSVAPILVRTQMDFMIQTMAITLNDKPDLMGYKYMYSSSKKGINEQLFPAAERARAKRTADDGLKLLPEELRDEAKQFAFQDKLPSYWYAAEYRSPKDLLKQFMPSWEDIYDGLSQAAHGGYIGSRLFRDNPDDLDLEPRDPGPAAQRILSLSARFMLDQTLYRANFAGLDISESKYAEFREELDVFMKRVGQPQVTDEDRKTLSTHQRLRPTMVKKK